jgi:phosphoesterase RecJ-like protein
MHWSRLRDLIENNQSFMITSHVRPDADAIGSELGVAAILRAFGKQVTIVNASAPPPNLMFMVPEGTVLKLGQDIHKNDLPQVDVHVIVDTSAWQQLGTMADVIQKSDATRVVIDHHVSSDRLNAIEFKSVQAAATGELVCQAAEHLEVEFDTDTASALYAAIATDTGWFRFPSTTPVTMQVASDLMKQGAKPHYLYNMVNEQRSLAQIRLGGLVLGRIQTDCDGRLLWIYADKSDFEQTSAIPADTESLVNQCLTVAGSQAAFIAVELPNGQIKFSLRCRPPYSVSEMAESLGGGGHRLASGATLNGPIQDAIEQVHQGFVRILNGSGSSAN